MSSGLAAVAQSPVSGKAVAVAKEPHHHLVLTNSFVRAYRVSVPVNEATLLHQHELPYVSLPLGPADFTNAVEGKPEVHAKLVDGQVGYSRGGFAHSVRTDFGMPFNNVTVELVHPQGEPRNICQKITEGPLNGCPSGGIQSGAPDATTPYQAMERARKQQRLFETDEILVTYFTFAMQMAWAEFQPAQLLIMGQDSELQVDQPGERPKLLRSGEVMWFDAGKRRTLVTPPGGKVTHFLLITFKDGAAKKP